MQHTSRRSFRAHARGFHIQNTVMSVSLFKRKVVTRATVELSVCCWRKPTMSANKTKKVKMATKSCPECDQQIPVACKSCTCGYVFISRKLLNAKLNERSSPALAAISMTSSCLSCCYVGVKWLETALHLMVRG
uniref:UPF0547 protein C16orf87 homolog isoform X5 n=1 Tax=Scatophagus argus TaxID=75038 RepID=UPI001ED85570|nr:UPF0547 protein C16orf87 homolog isoform X5 [Scatophagus argus]